MFALPDPQIQPDVYKDVPLKRLLAWVVDSVLILALCIVMLPFTAFSGVFFFPLLFLSVSFGYRVVTLANGSATLGMRLCAIELRRADGSAFDAGTAFTHTLGYSLSWMVPVVQLISVVMMASTEKGQGLSDHALGTVMVNRRAHFR
jgi:uncharacterized RDD family membrane protein YckC